MSEGFTYDQPILVTGATGKQGYATARRLLAAGRPVRALVRDPAAPDAAALADAGARLVSGDFDDPESLRPALDGAGAVFGVPTGATGTAANTDPARESARARTLIDAIVAAGVERVVFSTVAPSSTSTPRAIAKQEIERYLRDHVARATVLRPVRFMTNYLSTRPIGIDGIDGGVHRHLFPPRGPMQIIALEDVAEFAARAFADPARFAGRTLDLAGDDPTPVAAAAAITSATGVPVRYEQLTHDEAAAIGPGIAEAREQWADGDRWHADIEALRVIHPGMRTLGDWLAEGGAAALRARLTGGRTEPRFSR